MTVYSTRLPRDVARSLEDEATRRGVTPSALIRQLVETALAKPAEDATVTVRLSDLHRAIDTIVRPADMTQPVRPRCEEAPVYLTRGIGAS